MPALCLCICTFHHVDERNQSLLYSFKNELKKICKNQFVTYFCNPLSNGVVL